MTLVKSISGIRGIINSTLTKEVIESYVLAFSQIASDGIILLARDTRNSGEEYISLSKKLLISQGRNVINCEIIPTPTAQHYILEKKCAGGIVFTASHNPNNWNGMKFINSKGIFINQEQFLQLEQKSKTNLTIKGQGNIKSKKSIETNFSKEAISSHIHNVLNLNIICPNKIKSEKLKVVIDCVNGAACKALPQLFAELNCEVIELFCNYNENFSRNPEPIANNLEKLSECVIKNKADIGFATDPDGDRLSIINEKGIPLGEELTLPFCVYYLLKYFQEYRKTPIVTNLSTSMLSEVIANSFSTPFLRTRVGEINVVNQMIESNSFLGGEGNGGVILNESHLGRDSLVGSAMILSLLVNEQKKISEIADSFESFFIEKSSLKLNNFNDLILSKIKNDFSNQKCSEIDGLKIEWEREWVHIRKSNTEPILRIISESTSKEKAKELINIIKNKIELYNVNS